MIGDCVGFVLCILLHCTDGGASEAPRSLGLSIANSGEGLELSSTIRLEEGLELVAMDGREEGLELASMDGREEGLALAAMDGREEGLELSS